MSETSTENKKTWVSGTLRNWLLGWLMGNSITTPSIGSRLYLALSTTEPKYDEYGKITNISEPSKDQNYARFMIGDTQGQPYSRYMRNVSNGQTDNVKEIKFNQAKRPDDGGAGWGSIGYWAIYSSEEIGTGEPWLAGELKEFATVDAGMVFVIKASSETNPSISATKEDNRGDFRIDFNTNIEKKTEE